MDESFALLLMNLHSTPYSHIQDSQIRERLGTVEKTITHAILPSAKMAKVGRRAREREGEGGRERFLYS